MIQIRKEAEDIITGKQPKDNNVLKNAPHPISVIALSEEEWNRCVLLHHAMCRASLICPQSLFPSDRCVPHAMAPREEVLAHHLAHR